MEIIIVDDKSPDNSVEIVEQFMEKDPRVRLVTLENNSCTLKARVVGYQHAQGDYVFNLDSDDYMPPNKFLHKAAHAIVFNDYPDVLKGEAIRVHPDGQWRHTSSRPLIYNYINVFKHNRKNIYDLDHFKHQEWRNSNYVNGLLIKREKVNAVIQLL